MLHVPNPTFWPPQPARRNQSSGRIHCNSVSKKDLTCTILEFNNDENREERNGKSQIPVYTSYQKGITGRLGSSRSQDNASLLPVGRRFDAEFTGDVEANSVPGVRSPDESAPPLDLPFPDQFSSRSLPYAGCRRTVLAVWGYQFGQGVRS